MLPSRSSSTSLIPDMEATTTALDPAQAKRTWTIALFSITTILLFADQNLMAPSLSEIAEEFGFDDEERDRKLGGDISLAFFLLGAPASIVIGCLADSSNRSVLFAWTVFIGEGACLATYWVQTYKALYVCRAVTGFSVGGAVPLIYSILGDLFAAKDRHVISALVSFGTGAGIAVGQAVAGFLGPISGWRLPFLVVALPALVTAMLVLFTVPDPQRGAMDMGDDVSEDGVSLVSIPTRSDEFRQRHKMSYKALHHSDNDNSTDAASDGGTSSGASIDDAGQEYYDSAPEDCRRDFYSINIRRHLNVMSRILSTPTAVLAIIQGAPGCITWGVINVFLNDFLSEDRGFTIQAATSILMFLSLGNACGLFLLGGGVAQKLYLVNKRYPALLAGFSAVLGCLPLWFLMNKVTSETPYWQATLSAASAGFLSGPTGPIIKATLTNVTLPQARGQAFAFFNLFDDFGKGLGPFFVSLLISSTGERLSAFNLGLLGWVLCGMANLVVYFFVENDEAAMQAEIALLSERDLSS